jgi:hypothetical protein
MKFKENRGRRKSSILLLLLQMIFLASGTAPGSGANCVVIAANLFNSAKILPRFQQQLAELEYMLRRSEINTGLSIYENGSTDRTSLLVSLWNRTVEGTRHRRIIASGEPFPDTLERISRLVIVRNRALSLAREVLSDMENCTRGYFLFLNDVVYDAEDVFSMVADGIARDVELVCAKDVYRGFYDRWVTRDGEGMIPSRWATDFFRPRTQTEGIHPRSAEVDPHYWTARACWNGAVLIKAASAPAAFRTSLPDSCYASECKLFADDVFGAHNGHARFFVRTDVTVSYDITHLVLHKRFLVKYTSLIRAFQRAAENFVNYRMKGRRSQILKPDPCPRLPMLCC